ncbi:hypothetical protein [Undibacterium sp.]|uniref:hypothetical protein n=1 Tax=Undibacterium sp. TaxID=1914977 RepID=UPI002730E2B6|nr:hypothetical protein [Undibacterium sp.]MDP1978686.1 hypothetical protein [Undibacterium sp.]
MKKCFASLAISACLFFIGCNSYHHEDGVLDAPLTIRGSFEADRYFDQQRTFSIEIPKEFCGFIEEFEDVETGIRVAIFHQALGELIRLEISTFPEELMAEVFLTNSCPEMFLGVLENCVVKIISKDFPGTHSSALEWIHISEEDLALFAILEIPHSSPRWEDLQTSQRLSSYRGYLLFVVDNQFVVMSYQLLPSIALIGPPTRTQVDWVRDKLLDLKKVYRNESVTLLD